MRPCENGYGVKLESEKEVRIAQQCAFVTAEYFKVGAEQTADDTSRSAGLTAYASIMGQLHQIMTDSIELHELGDRSQPLTLDFPDDYSSELFETMLRIGAKVHEDPTVRTAASELSFSYMSHTTLANNEFELPDKGRTGELPPEN